MQASNHICYNLKNDKLNQVLHLLTRGFYFQTYLTNQFDHCSKHFSKISQIHVICMLDCPLNLTIFYDLVELTQYKKNKKQFKFTVKFDCKKIPIWNIKSLIQHSTLIQKTN